MSGGALFDYRYPCFDDAVGKWGDAEVEELYRDLFVGGEFSVRGYGGLAQSLDFWLSGDTGEEDYRDALSRFKAKWFHRTPRNRVEFYRAKIREYADRCADELACVPPREGAPDDGR